jgi:transcriptional regulator with XRE-family HTH domain
VSQRELARRLGKPPSFVNKIELLERRLDVLEFVIISRALGLDAGELMTKILNLLPEDISL